MNEYIINTLKKKKLCSIATFNGVFIDNAVVFYLSQNFNIYFGAYNYTTKCKFINVNKLVALTIGNIQIHGRCVKIGKNSLEYEKIKAEYLEKFPYYGEYLRDKNNYLYKVTPLVLWMYDNRKSGMNREKIIFNEEYYKRIKPYDYVENIQLDYFKYV
ncbi:hypothetical protein [Clostridium sp. D46t1_190503_E9]|uniref:hypothetical protein n=1 Tax=Clostridium sp. D46t1_190503_E9 TaxID=2787137 RepID=UPI00189796C5|nr:hypothetical protein [Clostridium sp. D46t1_190503_E9]